MTNSEQRTAALAALKIWSIEATQDFKKTSGVMPAGWLQMEHEYGTLGACQQILKRAGDWWMPVLTHFWEHNRLHFSAEAAAPNPQFAILFTAEERSVAQARLDVFAAHPVAG